MITAIVMISCDTTRIPEVAQAIADLPAVSEVYSTTGEVDLIAIVRVREFDEVADAIAGGIAKVAGVEHTERQTLLDQSLLLEHVGWQQQVPWAASVEQMHIDQGLARVGPSFRCKGGLARQ